MTIMKHDRFAMFPKRCDKCNRLFWLEPYNIYYKMVGLYYEQTFKCAECQECAKKRKDKNESCKC